MTSDQTTVLQNLIDRIKAGDRAAIGELILAAQHRLRGLAAQILNVAFQDVKQRGEVDTAEVHQELTARLLDALAKVPLNDVQHLFCIAAKNVRWYLTDLCKREAPDLRGSDAAFGGIAESSVESRSSAKLTSSSNAGSIEQRLLECVDGLSEEHYEVIDLKYTCGLTHEEISQHLNVSTKTVQRRLDKAILVLREKMSRLTPDGSH